MSIFHRSVEVGGETRQVVDIAAIAGAALPRMPLVLRLLLENAARTLAGAERDEAIAALIAWTDNGTSQAEIAVQPGRVLMHDTTSTPALVDIAAMRDVLAENGADPASLTPSLRVDVSVDHSLAVEAYARPDAASLNLAHELRRNAERYRFLRWASAALPGVHIHPPGTGIMHTINLEQLATVIGEETRGGKRWAVPDTMIGTDSHTPMIDGLGVLGWGVGGLEAQTVMFGMPTVLRIPDVIGVRLLNRLAEGVMATDLALVVTQRLRAIGVSGEFVEFFGPGIGTLAAGERCVVANMAPEYGATTGYFPVDARTVDYLRATGRAESLLQWIEPAARALGIWYSPDGQPRYTKWIEIDLARVETHVAGPKRPQDLRSYAETAAALKAAAPDAASFPIAIAAITSCTNTSDPRLLVAAGLLARKARAAGLRMPEGVKTSLAPGSPAAARYLARAGLDRDLSALGFDIVGFGCTTCIGNSGPLPTWAPASAGVTRAVAVLSGNRNFPGRVHPELDLAFIMSPPLVVAFALAGDAARNLRDQSIQEGSTVTLRDLWPTMEEVDSALAQALDPSDYRSAFRIASAQPQWHALQAPATPQFPWNPRSTILRRPPFANVDEPSQLGSYIAHPLLVVGDDVTTDHISPASAIPRDSLVADFLVERGDDRGDLNVFASRRGNWEVMVRAAFHAKSLRNLFAPDAPVAHTIHVPSGEVVPLWEAAHRYRQAGESVVVVAGERYGTGSSRDWAAKGQRLLGIRAVLAQGFERIHRSNLVGMGILPLKLPPGLGPKELALRPGDRIEVNADADTLAPRSPVILTLLRHDGRMQQFEATAAVETELEVRTLRASGVIPLILRNVLSRKAA